MKKFIVSVAKSVVVLFDRNVKKVVAVGVAIFATVNAPMAHATGSFPDITTVAGDAVTLIASLIALGVTILGWKLGSRWIRGIAK